MFDNGVRVEPPDVSRIECLTTTHRQELSFTGPRSQLRCVSIRQKPIDFPLKGLHQSDGIGTRARRNRRLSLAQRWRLTGIRCFVM